VKTASEREPFDLLETLRWTPDEGFFLLERHLQRLEASARYANYGCSLDRIRTMLAGAVAGGAHPLRVRLLVDRDGEARVERAPLEPMPNPMHVALAAHPIDSRSPFLFHKTTNREHLERERLAGFDDTVLWNRDGDVTETLIANLVVDVDGRKVTPPIDCGLLPGTLRGDLLARGEIVERRVSIEQLRQASQFWLINSVRGWMDAVLTASPVHANP
jgi:para-aminobenzoate synthetase/4-amino-4-deoxychorismate lyase